MANVNEQSETTTEDVKTTGQATGTADDNKWVVRFEELLKVKNLEELKGELTKLAGEIQAEIQTFDLNAHLSPSAKARVKVLEARYNQVIRSVGKAQKQFDREFNKSLRVLKATKADAEKQLSGLKLRINKHRATLVKASKDLKKKLKAKTGGKTKAGTGKRAKAKKQTNA